MRGYLEILPGWDAENAFVVMDWSEHGDSGWCAGAFPSRQSAVAFAVFYADTNRRFLHRAQVIPFPMPGAA